MYTSKVAKTLTLGKLGTSLDDLSEVLKALADRTRLELVTEVYNGANNEACVCDLTDVAGLSQGTVSHHLRVLVEVGILDREQRGKWAYFTLTELGTSLMNSLGIKKSKIKSKNC